MPKFLLYDGNVLRFFKQRYHDVYANIIDTLIEGLKIGKEKVILMKLQNFGVRMIRLSLEPSGIRSDGFMFSGFLMINELL